MLLRHKGRFRERSEEDYMSANSYQQYFEGPAKRGSRSIHAGHEATVGLALIYAAIGASLGILSGTAVAVVYSNNSSVATSNLAQASASVAGMNGPLKTIVAQVPMVQNQPAFQAAEMPATPHASAAVETNSGRKSLAVHPLTLTHKDFSFNALVASSALVKKSQPNADAAPAPSKEPISSTEVALAEVPVATPVFMIEGDATVADYDATTGLVETHEGKSFSVGTSVGASSSWDDYSGHVHYRCDPGGNCTLSRAGVVVPHARMAT
jgi:hypothetical protein